MPPPALPEELLQQILSHLRITSGRDDPGKENRLKTDTLMACALVSTAFARISATVLYHTLDMVAKGGPPIFPLVIQLAGRPDLACHVKTLSAPDEFFKEDEDSIHDVGMDVSRSKTLFADTVLDFARDASSLSLEMAQDLINDFALEPYSACVTLLLAICPHLEVLIINTPHPIRMDSPIVAALLRNLSRVHEVSIGQSGLQTLSLDDIVPLLGIPKLKTLRIHELKWDEMLHLAAGQPWSLEHLYLEHAHIYPSGFTDVLKAFPMLQTLHIEWYPGRWGTAARSMITPTFGHALQQYGSHLRKLNLDTCLRTSEDCRQSRQIASLASLEQLQYLSLPSEILIHDGTSDAGESVETEEHYSSPWLPLTAILPRSLKLLRVYDEWNTEGEALRVDEQLELLMIDPQFAQLRRIRVRRRAAFTGDADSLGWREVAPENQYWMMLNRKSCASNDLAKDLQREADRLSALRIS